MQQRPRVRGTYAKTEARRKEIVDAAETLFGEVGFRAASMREIARRCELSVAGLMHHFPGKSDLLLAVLARREALGDEFLRFGASDPIAPLRGAREMLGYNLTIPVLLEGWVMLAGEAATRGHPAREFFAAHYEHFRSGLGEALGELARAGRLRPGVDPETAATTVLAIIDGVQLQYLLDDSVDAGAALDDYLALIIKN